MKNKMNRIFRCFLFLRLLRCFTSAGIPLHCCRLLRINTIEFPHSEIAGSKVASHFPDAYRRHATSFIALISQGIHHSLITYPSINSILDFLKIKINLSKVFFKTLYHFLSRYLCRGIRDPVLLCNRDLI